MASGPGAKPDFTRRYSDLEEQVRVLKIANKRHLPAPTFIVSGDVDNDTFIPPVHISLESTVNDQQYPQDKAIVAFDGWAESGSVTVQWETDDATISPVLTITGSSNRHLLATPWIIDGFDWVRPVILGGSATNLALACIVEIIPV